MSIRWKLLWSYAAMLIIPLLFLVLISSLLLIVFRGDAQNIKAFYESKIEGIEQSDYHRLVKHTFAEDPELLTNTAYLRDLSVELASRQISIFVRQGNQALYASTGIAGNSALTSDLPPYEHLDFHKESTVKINNNEWYQIVQYDLKAADDKPVTLFLLTKIDPLVHFAKDGSRFFLPPPSPP